LSKDGRQVCGSTSAARSPTPPAEERPRSATAVAGGTVNSRSATCGPGCCNGWFADREPAAAVKERVSLAPVPRTQLVQRPQVGGVLIHRRRFDLRRGSSLYIWRRHSASIARRFAMRTAKGTQQPSGHGELDAAKDAFAPAKCHPIGDPPPPPSLPNNACSRTTHVRERCLGSRVGNA
jgi:hypothetical protein